MKQPKETYTLRQAAAQLGVTASTVGTAAAALVELGKLQSREGRRGWKLTKAEVSIIKVYLAHVVKRDQGRPYGAVNRFARWREDQQSTRENDMSTKRHKRIIDRLTTDIGKLAVEFENLRMLHNAFQSAFKNPYSPQMKDLNERWDRKLAELRDAVRKAIEAGIRKTTVAGWLRCVDQMSAIQDLIRFECEQF